MKKIKQSFFEVIAGEPKKEHYISVFVTSILIATVVGIVLTLTWSGQY